MHDGDLENLLRRYRLSPPNAGLWEEITKSPNRQIAKSDRAWPWAVAAAALLAITVGLHAAVVPGPQAAPALDPQRVQAIAEELGATPESRVVVEWMARREVRAEQEARAARAAAPGIGQP